MKRKLIAALITLSVTLTGHSVLISDFTSPLGGVNFTGGLGTWNNGTADQFTVSGGVLTIGSVSGGSPDNAGYFAYADIAGTIPLNGTGLTQLSLTAQIGAANFAPGFIVNFFDGSGNGVITATFPTTGFTSAGFTTQTIAVSAHPNGGLLSDIQSYGIAGTGSTQAFNYLISNISLNAVAIPEPSTYAAIFGALALGLVAYRRRRQPA